jgi:hypothetical protein
MEDTPDPPAALADPINVLAPFATSPSTGRPNVSAMVPPIERSDHQLDGSHRRRAIFFRRKRTCPPRTALPKELRMKLGIRTNQVPPIWRLMKIKASMDTTRTGIPMLAGQK